MTRINLVQLPPKYQKQILQQLDEKPKKVNKYSAKKITIDGHTFDSKREAEYYQELKMRKRAGEIKDFELQPEFTLQEAFKKNGRRYRAIKYRADFKVIFPDGRIEIVDVKGYSTKVFAIKRKLFEYRYPELTLKIVK